MPQSNIFGYLGSQSVVDGREFFKPESMNPIMSCFFPIWYFFQCCSRRFQSASAPSSSYHSSFSILLIHSTFLLFYFCSHSLLQICFVCLFVCLFGGAYGCCCCYVLLHSPLISRIFFYYFRMSCFACIFWPCLCNFWVSLLSPKSFDLSLQAALGQTCQLFCFGSFHPKISRCVFLP